MKSFAKPSKSLTLFAILLATTFLGCGGSQRQSIEGTVTFNGEKVGQGSIRFLPAEGTKGPSGGAQIVDGKFSLDQDKGVFTGTFRVEIFGMKSTGRQVKDPMGDTYEERIQYLPPKYNRESTLTQEISSGHNELTFDLTS